MVGEHPVVPRVAHPSVARAGAGSHEKLSSLPLAAQGVVSAALGSDSGAYRVSGSGGGYRRSILRSVCVRALPRGRARAVGGSRLGLRLGAVGYGGSRSRLRRSFRGREATASCIACGAERVVCKWTAWARAGLSRSRGLLRAAPRAVDVVPGALWQRACSVDAGGRSLMFAGPGRLVVALRRPFGDRRAGAGAAQLDHVAGGRVLLHVDALGASYRCRSTR